MAYNIYTPGAGKFSANSNVIFLALEDTNRAANNDFKYICDVYIGTLQARLKAVPDPTTGQGIFDIGPIIRSYINTTAQLNAGIVANTILNYVEVQCKFGMEYGVTTDYNVVTDSARKFYNYYQSWPNVNADVLTAYNNHWLTDRPAKITIDPAKIGLLLPFYRTTASSFSVAIAAYNAAGLITTTTLTVDNSSADNVKVLDLSRQNLYNVSGILNQTDLEYYTIAVSGATTYQVNLQCQKKFETYPVVFLNSYGAYESHYFTKAHQKTIEVERKEYQKQGYVIGASGQVSYSANGAINQQRNTYAQQIKQRWTLKSDILTDAEFQWLGELASSVEAYIIMQNIMVPVIITSNSYQYLYHSKDALNALSIEVELSAPFNTQYR